MSINEHIAYFQFERILVSDPQIKTIALLGTIKGEPAILSLEKSHFITTGDIDVQKLISDTASIDHNDVYYWSSVNLRQSLKENPGAKLNVIYPATETHIRKFKPQKFHYFIETPDIYRKYVDPYIQTMKGDRIKWVYNILFEGKESETFVYHDKDPKLGFVVLPDMKWDRINLDALYLVTIVNRKDISSIRDLNSSHLTFLKNLKNRIVEVTSEKFGIEKDQLRLFVHYQPSYYHFHIHIVNIKHQGLKDGLNVGKAILLDDIIGNIELVGDYYQRRSLGYLIGENHGLWERFENIVQ